MAHTESTFNSRDLPFFDGSGDVEIFIEYVEKMTKIKGWSNEANKDNVVLHVCCALEKEAAVWASGIRLHNIGTWEEAKGRLLTRWKPPMTYMTAIATLVKEKKKPRESYYAYVDRLRNIARYNKDVTEDNVIEAFLKGIPHKYAITKPKEATAKEWNLDTIVLQVMEMNPTIEGEVSTITTTFSEMELNPGATKQAPRHAAVETPRTEDTKKMTKAEYDKLHDPTWLRGPNPDLYCTFCRRFGHDDTHCRSKDRPYSGPTTRSMTRDKGPQLLYVGEEENPEELLYSKADSSGRPRTCLFCGETGHFMADCYAMKKAREEFKGTKDKNKNDHDTKKKD